MGRWIAISSSWPKTELVRRQGPGRPDIELTAIEAAFVLLSLTSPRPQGAAAAARALGGLSPEPRAGDEVTTLLMSLTFTLEQMEAALRRGAPLDFGDPDWEMTLCLNPLRATMLWPSRKAVRHFWPYVDTKTIAPGAQPPPAFRRDFVLTQPALVAVARLHAGQTESAAPPRATLPVNEPTPDAHAEGSDRPTSSEPNPRVCVSATTHGDRDERRPGAPAPPD